MCSVERPVLRTVYQIMGPDIMKFASIALSFKNTRELCYYSAEAMLRRDGCTNIVDAF